MLKRVFNPRGWLSGFAIANFIAAGFGQLVSAESVAESGWGPGNVLPHDVYYETTYGFIFIGISIIALGLAFLTSGAQRARMTVLLGATMLLMLVSLNLYSNAEGYATGTVVVVPLTLMSLVALSGILHLKDEG